MPISTVSDRDFTEQKHPELGPRKFSISHSNREGVILIAIATVCFVVGAILFSLGREFYTMYAVLAVFIGSIFGILGVGNVLKSRAVVHVHQLGFEKIASSSHEIVFFEAIDQCKLNYISTGVTRGIGFFLSDGNSKIRIVDGIGRWDVDSKNKYDRLVNHVLDGIPDSVKIKGDHQRG